MEAKEIIKKWYKLNADYYDDLSKGICPEDTRAQIDYFLYCEIPAYLREDINLYDLLPDDLKDNENVINAYIDVMSNKINTKSVWYKEQIDKCWKAYNKEAKKAKKYQSFIPEDIELNVRTR